MPSAVKDDIIDLTEIVKEGHPEKPNLKPAKPSVAEDALDDLDLEKEIDQIFADLAPPDPDEQGASGKRTNAESDTLDLDELFEEKNGKAQETALGADGTGMNDDSALDFADDFDKLFAEEAEPQPKSRTKPEAKAEPATQSSDEPDWLAELDGLGLEQATPETAEADAAPEMNLEAERGDVVDSQSEPDSAAPLEDAQAEVAQGTTDELTESSSSAAAESVAAATGSGETLSPAGLEASDSGPADPEHSAEKQYAAPERAPHQGDDTETSPQSAMTESVPQRLQALEDRLAALENQEPRQIDVPGPDIDGLLAQVDERIAASPALAGLGASQAEAVRALEARLAAVEQQEPPQPDFDALLTQVDERIAASPALAGLGASQAEAVRALEARLAAVEQQEPPQPDFDALLTQVDERIAASPALAGLGASQAEALQALDTRLAAMERQEPPQPDTEGLLAQVNERIAEQIRSRLDPVMQTVDDMAGQAEVAAAKVVDTGMAKLSESILAEVDQRLSQRLEESFAERLEKRLDEFKASIQEDLEQRLSSAMDELKQGNGEQPEDPRLAGLTTGLDTLRDRIEELAQNQAASAAESGGLDASVLSGLQEREEQLETRLLATVRQEIQHVRTEWDGQKSALAKDLENSLNYWAKLQDKFKVLQGEWQAVRQEREAHPMGGQEAGFSALPEEWRAGLAALLDERLEILRGELRTEMADEMDKTVPLAAARIIREEILAMSQDDEDEAEQE